MNFKRYEKIKVIFADNQAIVRMVLESLLSKESKIEISDIVSEYNQIK